MKSVVSNNKSTDSAQKFNSAVFEALEGFDKHSLPFLLITEYYIQKPVSRHVGKIVGNYILSFIRGYHK